MYTFMCECKRDGLENCVRGTPTSAALFFRPHTRALLRRSGDTAADYKATDYLLGEQIKTAYPIKTSISV